MPMKYSMYNDSKKKFQSAQKTYEDFPPKHADTVSNALYNVQLQITAQSRMILVARFFFNVDFKIQFSQNTQ